MSRSLYRERAGSRVGGWTPCDGVHMESGSTFLVQGGWRIAGHGMRAGSVVGAPPSETSTERPASGVVSRPY